MEHTPIIMDKHKPLNYMISNGRELYDFIDKIIKPLGFIRKKNTWYLHTSDCICFLVIEKSPYGGYYEDLLGCFLKEIYDEWDEFPKYYKNNLKYGISDLTKEEIVRKAFDLEKEKFDDDEREMLIKDLIENYAILFLNDVSTKEGIKHAVQKYKGLKNRMDLKIKKALSIED